VLLVLFVIDTILSRLGGILLTYSKEILRILWLRNVMLTVQLTISGTL
jgi:hypothetical protein